MNGNDRKHYTDSLAILVVFAIFAVCVVLSLLAGASAYKRLSERDTSDYETRTCLQYIGTKLSNAQCPEAIAVVPFGDGNALRISEDFAGEEYCTYVFADGGYLCELYTIASDDQPDPASGEHMIELNGLSFEQDGSLITARLENRFGADSVRFYGIRGGERSAK